MTEPSLGPRKRRKTRRGRKKKRPAAVMTPLPNADPATTVLSLRSRLAAYAKTHQGAAA